jgi:hypothetical protein
MLPRLLLFLSVIDTPLFAQAWTSRMKELEGQIAQSWVVTGTLPERPVIFAV